MFLDGKDGNEFFNLGWEVFKKYYLQVIDQRFAEGYYNDDKKVKILEYISFATVMGA